MSLFVLLCVLLFAILVSARKLYEHEVINKYMRPSQLWALPLLDKKQRQSHSFFAAFDSVHGDNAQLLANCTERYMTQFLDHFNYRATVSGQQTYEQRYFVCGGKNWSPNSTIFFYTGNEANVELYVNHTGLMWENADAFNAIMVFAEHRYFGESLPFGSDEKDMDSENIFYLSPDQAMADYATLIDALKTKWNSWRSPVIGFGGSYGGMLCTWFRLKYPQFVDGCIAGSAPIVSFMGETPTVDYNFFAVGETYDCEKRGGNPNDLCAQNLQQSWTVIFEKADTEQGRQQLAQAFQLCKIPQDKEDGMSIALWISNALGFMTMGSYPYATSYMLNGDGILPPYPMRVGCSFLNQNITDDMSLLQSVRSAVGVFYNYTGNVACFNLNAEANNATQIVGELWNFLYCSVVFQTFAQNGNKAEPFDMFWYSPWNATQTAQGCFEAYGIETRALWAEVNYGGWSALSSQALSNVVFSNGELDPWRGGGVQNLNDTRNGVHSLIVPDAGPVLFQSKRHGCYPKCASV